MVWVPAPVGLNQWGAGCDATLTKWVMSGRWVIAMG